MCLRVWWGSRSSSDSWQLWTELRWNPNASLGFLAETKNVLSKRTLLIYFLIPFFLTCQYRRTQGLKGQNSMLLCQAIKWHIWRSGASSCYTPTWAEIFRIPFSKRPPIHHIKQAWAQIYVSLSTYLGPHEASPVQAISSPLILWQGASGINLDAAKTGQKNALR